MALSNEIDISVEQVAQNPVTIEQAINTDYNILVNKPKINDVTVEWNKTGTDYHLVSTNQDPTLNSGDGYTFNFARANGNTANLSYDAPHGVRAINNASGNYIDLRNPGNIVISATNGILISNKNGGASLALNPDEGYGRGFEVSNVDYATINNAKIITENDKATDSALGVVKVDGTTITADANGVISAAHSGGGTWGSITGTLSDQTDLQGALDSKQSTLSTAQQNAVNSGIDSTKVGQIATNTSDITTIEGKIPAQATSSNQLADKNFVNSSISTNTANFIGTFEDIPHLEAYSGTVTNNDYAFVLNSVIEDNSSDWATFADLDNYDKSLLTNFDYAWVVNGANFDLYRFDIVNQTWGLRVSDTSKSSVTLNTAYNRYKATVTGGTVTWSFEYTLNNSSFTAAQWAAINSGITDTAVDQIATNTAAIATKISYALTIREW